jgi:hypothetical protein
MTALVSASYAKSTHIEDFPGDGEARFIDW